MEQENQNFSVADKLGNVQPSGGATKASAMQQVDDLVIDQIAGLSSTANALATTDVAKAIAQENIDYENQKLAILDEMSATLASREEATKTNPVVRAFIGLFDYSQTKAYHDEKLESQMNQLGILSQANQTKHAIVQNEAMAAAGYNPLVEIPLAKAQAQQDKIIARDAAKAEADYKNRRLQADLLIAQDQSKRGWADLMHKSRVQSHTEFKDMYDIKKGEVDALIAEEQKLYDRGRDQVADRKWELEQGVKLDGTPIEVTAISGAAAKKRLEGEKAKKELAELTADNFSTKAQFAANQQGFQTASRMNNGTMVNQKMLIADNMMKQAELQPDETSQIAMQSKANEFYKSAIDESIKRLPKGAQPVAKARLDVGGVLPATYKSTAADGYMNLMGTESATPSIEGRIFRESKPMFATAIKEAWENLRPDEQKKVQELLGSGGKFDASILFSASEKGISTAEIGKLIRSQEILDRVLTTSFEIGSGKDKKVVNFTQSYQDALMDNYDDFFMEHVVAMYGNDPKLGSQLMGIKSMDSNIGVKLDEVSKLLVARGLDNDVPNLLNQYQSPTMVQKWRDYYRNNAVAYDDQAALMMPLLGFDKMPERIIQATNSDKANKALRQILSNAMKLRNEREMIQQTITNGGANAPTK